MVVLSLFDGMSCGMLALQEAGINVDIYYSSEVDAKAIKVSRANYPSIVQLGDIKYWRSWDIDWGSVDLVLAGSPCQGFSFAGVQLGFDDPRSSLFFVFGDILNHVMGANPSVFFLLENVKMKKESELAISRSMGVNPLEINSSLVSAQNRVRNYWTNIGLRPVGLFGHMECSIPQPKDSGILLRDILEKEVDEKYYLSEKMLSYFDNRAANFNNGKVNIREQNGKATTLTSSMASCDISDNFIKVDTTLRPSKNQSKANCFTAGGHSGGLHSDMTLIASNRESNPLNPKRRKSCLNTGQMLEARFDGKTNCLTKVQKDNYVIQLNPSTESGGKQPYQQNRVYDDEGKSPALLAEMTCGSHAIFQRARGFNKGEIFEDKSPPLTANSWQNNNTLSIRRLTPVECERLQCVPDNFTNHVSDTARYRMLGNGWNVATVAHILSYITAN
jgi:site-specific DNA-cytosine methylase